VSDWLTSECRLCFKTFKTTKANINHECAGLKPKEKPAMGFRFTKEHFSPIENYACTIEEAAHLANAALDKYLSECPVVSGNITGNYAYEWKEVDKHPVNTGDTHRAVLFGVEKIEAKECEHKAVSHVGGAAPFQCDICHIKLKIKWEPA
jgi:hypothetical protein